MEIDLLCAIIFYLYNKDVIIDLFGRIISDSVNGLLIATFNFLSNGENHTITQLFYILNSLFIKIFICKSVSL